MRHSELHTSSSTDSTLYYRFTLITALILHASLLAALCSVSVGHYCTLNSQYTILHFKHVIQISVKIFDCINDYLIVSLDEMVLVTIGLNTFNSTQG